MKRKGTVILVLLVLLSFSAALTGCAQSSSSGNKGPIRLGQATALTTEYTVVGQYWRMA